MNNPSEHLATRYEFSEMDRVTAGAVKRPKGANLVLEDVAYQPRPDRAAAGLRARRTKTAVRTLR